MNARFFMEGDMPMFAYDGPYKKDGPRPANEVDRMRYREQWVAFELGLDPTEIRGASRPEHEARRVDRISPGRPQFFMEDDVLMFVYNVDRRNTIGPRPATLMDQKMHPGPYDEFVVNRDQLGEAPVDPGPDDGGDIVGHAGSTPAGPRKRGRPRTRSGA